MATQTRAPTSDVSFTGTWTGSAGSRFQNVDDHPDSGNPIADGLTHGTTAGEGLFGFSAFSIPSGSTNISVQVIYYDFKSASQACNIRARIRCNDTTGRDAPGGTHNPGNGNGNIALRTDNYATNPKSGAAWTVDDVNGVGTNGLTAFGVVSTDASPSITISSIMLQVTYDPPQNRAQVSWAEFEVPNAPRRSQVSWAELEVPTAPRRAQLSWAELETPDAIVDRRAQVSFAELEIPTAPRRGLVSFAELEVPTAPRRAQLSHAELEVPTAPRRAWVSFSELEVPTAPRRALLSHAELEIPTAPRRALLSWAEFYIGDEGLGIGILNVASITTIDDTGST